MILRDYQTEFVDRCFEAFESFDTVAGILPTGCGKTVCFVEIANRWQHGRVMVIAPRIELVRQAAKKIQKHTGIAPAIEQANNKSNEDPWARSPYVVASKPTLHSMVPSYQYRDRFGVMQTMAAHKRYQKFADVGLVIIDEAHEALSPGCREIVDFYRADGAKVLGVTASKIARLGEMYDTCAYDMQIDRALDAGWLVPARCTCWQLESLDLSHVKSKRDAMGVRDFNEKQLQRALEDESVVYEIAEITARESRGLKTVVFCASVEEARKVANLLKDQHGYRAEWICGDNRCSKEKRYAVLNSFTSDEPGAVEIVANVGVLSTGWDFPGLEHIVIARPTQSFVLYQQIVGRGTRPLEGVVDFDASTPELRKRAIANSRKPFFKLTDLRDNSLYHKLVSPIDLFAPHVRAEVKAVAIDLLAGGGEAKDLAQVIKESEAEAAERERLEKIRVAKQLQHERDERERLAAIRAEAEFAGRDVDLLDDSQRGPLADHGNEGVVYMTFSKYRDQPISLVPTGYLIWMRKQWWVRQKYRTEYEAAGVEIAYRKKLADQASTPAAETSGPSLFDGLLEELDGPTSAPMETKPASLFAELLAEL